MHRNHVKMIRVAILFVFLACAATFGAVILLGGGIRGAGPQIFLD